MATERKVKQYLANIWKEIHFKAIGSGECFFNWTKFSHFASAMTAEQVIEALNEMLYEINDMREVLDGFESDVKLTQQRHAHKFILLKPVKK